MMLMHALVCAAMLPALVVAERFFFGGCNSNFDSHVDPIAHTAQGVLKMKEFATTGEGKLYLWNPLNKEKDQGVKSVKLWLRPQLDSFILTYSMASSVTPITITGSITYQYIPKIMIQLKTPVSSSILSEIFGFDNNGEADLYPVLLSKTDLVLRGCADAFLGRVESLYVLTNQDYSTMDSVCTRQTIREKFHDWDVVVAPQ